MVATWPTANNFPTAAQWGWAMVPVDTAIRAEMEGFNHFARPRISGNVTRYNLKTTLNATQFATFLAFWRDGLFGGTGEFEWKRPYDGSSCNFRPVGQHNPVHLEADKIEVSFVVEEVP